MRKTVSITDKDNRINRSFIDGTKGLSYQNTSFQDDIGIKLDSSNYQVDCSNIYLSKENDRYSFFFIKPIYKKP
jgi:hypothetical protein